MGRSGNRRQGGSRRGGDRTRSDHWTQQAKDEGYAARSVFKVREIDERMGIVQTGARIVDLGCAPGSWSRYLRQRAGEGAVLIGVDINDVPGFPGTFLRQSVYDVDVEQLRDALGGCADLLVSDMAPSTTGARTTDHLRQVALAERALELTLALLCPGGAFVAKVFDGSDAPAFVERVRARFEEVRRVRPQATRTESREFFVVGRGFRA